MNDWKKCELKDKDQAPGSCTSLCKEQESVMDTAKGDQTRTVVEEHQEAAALLDGRRQAAAIDRRKVIL